ncbi:Rust resistance kinase Lr10, partial [Mucuna pruriens]
MGRIHHVNIACLVAFCADGFRRALVYEFLPNGSLQKFINSSDNRQNFLVQLRELNHNFTSRDKSIVSMTARGTLGYFAPKADVYSYGMMLLETIGGKKITGDLEENTSHVYYLEWIYNLLEEHEEMRIHIDDEGGAKIARKLAIVGLWCIQWHVTSMQTVVQMLEGDVDRSLIPPNPFAYAGPRSTGATARQLTQDLYLWHI